MEFTLLWAALTAFAAAFVMIRFARPSIPDRPIDRLLGAALVGIAVGRVAAMLIQGTNLITNPGELLVIRGGVDTVWASLAGVTVLAWPLRRTPQALDGLAPAALAGLAGWHGGCLWRSTCLGTMSDLPWTWALPGSDITRHPVEIYTALLFLAGAAIITMIERPVGAATAMALAWAGLARLVTEPLRPSLGAGLWWFYALAGVIGLTLVVYLVLRTRQGADKTTP